MDTSDIKKDAYIMFKDGINNIVDFQHVNPGRGSAFVRTRLSAHEYPREVEFVTELPLTTTGKIMRRELRRLDAEKKAPRRG